MLDVTILLTKLSQFLGTQIKLTWIPTVPSHEGGAVTAQMSELMLRDRASASNSSRAQTHSKHEYTSCAMGLALIIYHKLFISTPIWKIFFSTSSIWGLFW